MNLTSTKTNAQEILITSVHYQECVVEVYLNKDKNTITELKHKANHKVSVYNYILEDYLSQQRNKSGVNKKIKKVLHAF